jgi:acetyl-CoA C-acetyltransferase
MSELQDPVILSAARLPTGRFLGALKDFTAPALGALAVREAVARAGIDAALVEQCYLGNVVSAGQGQAPARQAALRAGLSDDVSAVTVNQVCGSGSRRDDGRAGDSRRRRDAGVAGGMESMSRAPYLLARVREGCAWDTARRSTR